MFAIEKTFAANFLLVKLFFTRNTYFIKKNIFIIIYYFFFKQKQTPLFQEFSKLYIYYQNRANKHAYLKILLIFSGLMDNLDPLIKKILLFNRLLD